MDKTLLWCEECCQYSNLVAQIPVRLADDDSLIDVGLCDGCMRYLSGPELRAKLKEIAERLREKRTEKETG